MPGKKKTDYELVFPFCDDELDIISGNMITQAKVISPVSKSPKLVQEETPNYKTTSTATVVNKKETPKQTSGTPVKGSLTISLAGLNRKTQPEIFEPLNTEIAKANKSVNAFTLDQLYNALAQFAESVNSAGKRNLGYTLQSNMPKVKEDNTVEFVVDSKAQEEAITNVKPDLLSYLRTNLKNDNITISIIVSQTELPKTPYTAMEKFREMAKKNPNINKLKNDFDLDLGS